MEGLMGLASFISKQFIDVIQWTESDDDVLAWRFPTADLEIQQGAALIVRDTQVALFVDDGRLADRFEAGRYVLHTKNLPLLTDLRNWGKLFESPFKSEVYFFSTRLRVAQAFGTPQPVTVRDREFGSVRVRAFGRYAFRIADAGRFHQQVSGTRDTYRVADVEGQLRAILASALAAHLGTSDVPFLDMAANQAALAAGTRERANAACEALGIAIADVQIENLSLPDEVQQRLDERIGMGMVGDLGRYTQFQTGRAIPVAAASDGGAAGAGVGVGAGVAMGQAMAQAITGARPSSAPTAALTCPNCSATLERTTRFCPECGQSLA
jgi:membrane protease subunit (stomatin/prohibitin family)